MNTMTDPEMLAQAILAAANKQTEKEKPRPTPEPVQEVEPENVETPDNDFGLLVKKVRNHFSMTQSEFADELDVCFTTINRWERGKNVPTKVVQNKIKEMARSAGLLGPEVSDKILNGNPTIMKAKAIELGLVDPELEKILGTLSVRAQTLILEAILSGR